MPRFAQVTLDRCRTRKSALLDPAAVDSLLCPSRPAREREARIQVFLSVREGLHFVEQTGIGQRPST